MTQPGSGFQRGADGRARLGGRPLDELLHEAGVSTPAYFYDIAAIRERVRELEASFGAARHLVAYAVKANSAGTILKTLFSEGAGADAVSGGELLLARGAGAPADKIVLSGVAKRDDEIDLAMEQGILAIQAESVTELARVRERARISARVARVALRINPSVQIDSHAHIATGHDRAKFGIARADLDAALELIKKSSELTLVGISTHVGSMLKKTNPYLESARVVCEVAVKAREQGHGLEYVDFGGGFGIDYGEGPAETPAAFAQAALRLLAESGLSDLMLVVEPGRSMVGPYGVLVSRVVHDKQTGSGSEQRRWVMIDAGMNDLLRPALYQARHRIEPLDREPGELTHRIVGPVCESTDDFGDHALGDVPGFVVIRDSGAYAFTMASEYNGRPLPAEVFVDQGRVSHINPSPGVDAWIASRLRA